MKDKHFDAYVTQIMAAKDRDTVVNLLVEFRDDAYLGGRHMLIDALRSQLDSFDNRKRK